MRRTKIKLPAFDSAIYSSRRKPFLFKKNTGGNFGSDFENRAIENQKVIQLNLFYFLLISVFLILVARLFFLTIVKGSSYRDIAENNRIRLVEEPAERGKIFDREGKLLAISALKYNLQKSGKNTEIEEVLALRLQKEGLAGENFLGELGALQKVLRRDYALGEAASHVIGYTTLPFEDDLISKPQLSPIESIGRVGIEESFDDFLRGKVGKKIIEVDASGRKISILGNVDPQKGRDIYLAIDWGLQRIAFDALRRQASSVSSRKGAVIIQNPQSGEILALVSLPSFDGEDIGKSVSDLEEPFLNRAIAGSYPPGSVFKIVSSLAGLKSGKITKDTEIEDVGEFEISGTRFANWYFLNYGRKDGVLNLERAIVRSNDIYFYRLGERVGLDSIRKLAIDLGFGQKTGVDLSGEDFGLVPDEVWKKSTLGENWFLGDTMHMAIGQGFLLATPLQINSMTSYVASGKLTKPFIVSKIDKGEGVGEVKIGGKVVREKIVEDNYLNLVRAGMQKACQTGGTGWPFFTAKYSVGCKTGTAERAQGNPHAWFTAFAPYEDPQIAITVLVENGGEGSSVAGPVAKEILDWYFNNR